MNRIVLTVLTMLFVSLWSSGWAASHYAITSSSALSVLSARYAVVVLLLLVIVTLLRQWQRIPRRELMFHLLIGALCHALYLLGSVGAFELGVSAAVIAFINALQPSATASISGAVTGEYIKTRHLKGLVLGIVAVVLIVSNSYYQSGVSPIALTLPFIAMLALSLGIVLNRRQEVKAKSSNHPPRPLTLLLLIHTFGASLIIVPMAALRGELHWQFTVTQWTAIAWLAIAVSLASYALLIFLLRHMSAVRVSSLTYLVPPATILQSYFLFGQTISQTDIVALCIASIAVYQILSNPTPASIVQRTTSNTARLARYRLQWVSARALNPDIRPSNANQLQHTVR
ncbi:MAG: DMT family transporter [Granulosicoccus sp.]